MIQKIRRAFIPKSLRSAFKTWETHRRLNSKTLPARLIGKVKPAWRVRINDVVACPDNLAIPRHPDAGKIDGETITMHNGIRIKALSYHGVGMLNMLVENKGVHEPQEERAFAEILPLLPTNPVSLEMGAYWSFYSLWLKTVRPGASCHLVEPEPTNLIAGQHNFAMNGFEATFTNAFIGGNQLNHPGCTPEVSVDGYCAENNIGHRRIQNASEYLEEELVRLVGCMV
jgi:hypothetical protein